MWLVPIGWTCHLSMTRPARCWGEEIAHLRFWVHKAGNYVFASIHHLSSAKYGENLFYPCWGTRHTHLYVRSHFQLECCLFHPIVALQSIESLFPVMEKKCRV